MSFANTITNYLESMAYRRGRQRRINQGKEEESNGQCSMQTAAGHAVIFLWFPSVCTCGVPCDTANAIVNRADLRENSKCRTSNT
jgi:hypothetical protein